MINIPIWLFVLSIVIGFPLLIIILTIVGYVIYLSFIIVVDLFKNIIYMYE